MSVITVQQTNFDAEVSNASRPVLLDFWAPWCGPCRMFSPIVDEIAEQYADSITVGKINIDKEPELAERFGVMSIPTLVLVKDGKPVGSTVGVQPKAAIEEMLK